MPVSRVQSLNAVQRIPEKSILQTVSVLGGTIYTCPAGKKAKIKYKFQCNFVHQDTIIAYVLFDGIILGRWSNLGTTGIFPPNTTWHNGGSSQIGSWVIGEKVIEAGQAITTDGHNGTSASINVFLDILEVPA